MYEKTKDDLDTPDVLFIKGQIRREEARTADRYIGLPDRNVHFLDLPFYETGQIKKNPISEKDVMIVKDFIETIKPNQIYVAGDLADPHGTHKVCLDAVLAAVDLLKDESWFEDCRIWMYRGAWMEWEIDHIEMAVPLSPEELRQKRNAILKHQSQMESAPFWRRRTIVLAAFGRTQSRYGRHLLQIGSCFLRSHRSVCGIHTGEIKTQFL